MTSQTLEREKILAVNTCYLLKINPSEEKIPRTHSALVTTGTY